MSSPPLSRVCRAAGLALGLVLAVSAPPSFAGQAFEQPEITVSATDATLAQGDAEAWDVLAVRDVQLRIKVAAATLDTKTPSGTPFMSTVRCRSGPVIVSGDTCQRRL